MFHQPVTWTDRVEADAELAKSHFYYDREIAAPGYVSINTRKDEWRDVVGGSIHSTRVCSGIGDRVVRRVPSFYEADGQRKVVWMGEEFEVEDCLRCPIENPYDEDSWRNRAACKDATLDPWGPDYPMFMDVYCEECPVQLECLEYGEGEGVGGMVFGGIYLSQENQARKLAIQLRKKELELEGLS